MKSVLTQWNRCLLFMGLVLLSATSEVSFAQEKEAKDPADKPAVDTLQSRLREMSEQSRKLMPAAMLDSMEGAIEDLRDSDLVETALKHGDSAIDATLKDVDGNEVTLSEQWKTGPVVLMWYRGGWCPYCNLQLQAMQKRVDAMKSAGVKLFVLTPELPEKASETIEKNQLTMTVLHDKGNQLARQYGLVFKLPEALLPLYRDRLGLQKYNGDDSMELPLAATYVIDSSGKIQYSFLEEDYKQRAEPADVVAAVRKLVGPPVEGQIVDDFSLPNLNGESVKLSEQLRRGPVVWVMLRGFPGYQCPICSRQVGQLVSVADELKAAGASVVMVYPGPTALETSLEKRASEFVGQTQLPDHFHFLVDQDYHVTDLYGLRWDAPRETAYPTTLVLNSDGKVVFSQVSKTHGGRSKVQDILNALR